MQLYHQTIQIPTAIHHCINGNFTGKSPKLEELIFVRGATYLELVSPDTKTTGKFKTIKLVNTFSIIQSIANFCFLDDEQDHLAITSDSGCLAVLKFQCDSRDGGEWKQIFLEAYGKSGLKRGIPGHFLAADPHGRALMIASTEKSKLAYTFSKEEEAGEDWIISSPLEAHRNKFITQGLVAIDTGHDNPLFAAIEVPFESLDGEDDSSLETIEKRITFYQVQLGLNTITRKVSQVIEFNTNFILPVLSGVLLSSSSRISFCRPGFASLSYPLPQRLPTSGYPNRPAIIINGAILIVKDKPLILLQNELGDIFKVEIDLTAGSIIVRYFDSISSSNSIVLLKTGFLFTASESTEHCLYQLESIGEDEDPVGEFFTPRPSPKNLVCVSTLSNYSIVSHAHINGSGEIWALRGRGSSNSPNLSILKSSINANLESSTPLDCVADSIWTFTEEIIYAGATGTFTLDSTPFNSSHSTLALGKLAHEHFVQVFDDNLIVFSGTNFREHVFQWVTPPKHKITHFSNNDRQVLLVLNHKTLLYFEFDDASKVLREHSKSIQMDSPVSSLSLSPVTEGMTRGLTAAVGTSDSIIHILSLRAENLLQKLVEQICASNPTALLITAVKGYSDNRVVPNAYYMHIGLANGVYVRMSIDISSGELSDPYSKALGNQPLRLKLIEGVGVFGEDQIPFAHVVAMNGENIWFATRNSDMLQLDIPLKDISIHQETYYGLGFDQIVKFTVPEVISQYSNQVIPLIFTPTRMQVDDESGLVVICEGEKASGVESDLPLWNSIVRIWDPQSKIFTAVVQLTDNEMATCAGLMRFSSRPGALFLVIGSARDYSLVPRSASLGILTVFLVQSDGTKPQLIHKTELPDCEIPSAVAQFSGRLLCGAGGYLRLYEMGKQRLLMKCSINLPTCAVNIQSQGLRIVVLDSRTSLQMFYYRPDDNRFYPVADEIGCRPPTNTLLCLDYDTWALGDRFGGIAILRLDRAISQEMDTDPGSSRLNQPSTLFAAPIKLERLAYIHLGEVVVGLGKVLGAHGRTCIRYVTTSGAIGTLAPIINKSQADTLEAAQLTPDVGLKERASLTGRNHTWFRSWFYPTVNIFDGDLLLSHTKDNQELKNVINTLQAIYL
jgi:splicing factor 3B subunit 3